MPTVSEHKKKYLENKDIIENVLDKSKKEHSDWITTICFYAVLHIVDMQLALDNIHSGSHREREMEIAKNERISPKIVFKYKQMCTNSKVARYGATSITPTIANQMILYLFFVKHFSLKKASEFPVFI